MKNLLLASSLALCAACTHMQVPQDLKGSPLQVDEKPGLFSGNLRLGPFRAMEISKGWIHGSTDRTGTWFGTVKESTASQDFSFRYEEEGQPPRDVACHAAFEGSETKTKIFGGTMSSSDGRESLECRFGPRAAAAPEGILRIPNLAEPGRLELGETLVEVQPNSAFDNGANASKPIGYVFAHGGQPIAAVDTNLTGAWLKKDLPQAQRTAAGLGATIMLLYRPQEPDHH